jgi:hypothetical protein
MPRKKNWRVALSKRESHAAKDDIRLVDSGHMKNRASDPTNDNTIDRPFRLVDSGHGKNRASDLGDTASLKRVQNLPSGARNTADLPSGARNTADLPSGARNSNDLPSGARNSDDLPSGATVFITDSPSGCTNSTDLPSGCTYMSSNSNLPNRQMIFGSFHQGDTRFSPFSRGSQCTCMALTMLLKSYEGFSFTSEFLDKTILAGDHIYQDVVQSLQKQNKFQHKLLKFDELPKNVTLGENHHCIQKFDTIWGLAICGEQSQFKTLHQSITEGFELSRYILIMLGSICSALYKASNGEYYFFDSHSHSIDGMSCSDGKSILVHSKSIDDTVSYLYGMYESMHIDLASQFEILPLSIRTLCHSFPCNNPSEKRYFRLDNIPTLLKSSDQNQSRKTYKKDYMREYMKKKREIETFRQVEKIKEASTKSLRRKNFDVRQKEMERDKTARKIKRQNIEVKEKERTMDKTARQLKRQSVEVKEKEREIDKTNRRIKRQNVEVKEKEREIGKINRQIKRQNVEIKQKENERETVARKLKRQNVEVKEKEREIDKTNRQIKRQNVEVKQKENERETVARKLKRQNMKVNEKERQNDKVARKVARQNVLRREKEQKQDRTLKRKRRENPHVLETE